eukprot:TRINITY_DN2722_c0_g2_i2.p3 TRINITY_DN2722_c0_g2~~TRINITY_DN2722_c0_g2_i2.p3  ORF type:complete len:112 (-),score=14.51 TRINITY_DN2722_c0_g2_i2:14-349(-)
MADMVRAPHVPARPGPGCHNLCPYVNFCPHAPQDATFLSDKAPGHNVKSWYVHKAPHSVQVDVKHLEVTHQQERHHHNHDHHPTEPAQEEVASSASADESADCADGPKEES